MKISGGSTVNIATSSAGTMGTGVGHYVSIDLLGSKDVESLQHANDRVVCVAWLGRSVTRAPITYAGIEPRPRKCPKTPTAFSLSSATHNPSDPHGWDQSSLLRRPVAWEVVFITVILANIMKGIHESNLLIGNTTLEKAN